MDFGPSTKSPLRALCSSLQLSKIEFEFSIGYFAIFEHMNIDQQKLSLIERLMKVRQTVTLDKVEELLNQSELELRAKESLEAIAKDDMVTLDQFKQSNKSWLKQKATK